ncbi:MAG: PASTA domain-containing protein [Ruminococcus sp.]|nr:PASTA domain-containing protein [Ruminococcus sp.]
MNSKALMATTALILALSAVSCGKDDGENSAIIAYGEATNTTTVAETTKKSDETNDLKMPDFYGMDYNAAVSHYENNIQFEVEGADYNELEAGLIFEQSVDPGTEFKPGDVLKVKISKGIETVEMPDVTNMHSDLARDQLAMLGLECEIRETANIEITPDYVISTEPEAKTEVNKGETIILYVSTGVDGN